MSYHLSACWRGPRRHVQQCAVDSGGTMSWAECANIAWRWHSLVPQIARDYQCHRKFGRLETPMMRRFAEQLALLLGNRISAIDYYKMGLFDGGMPMRIKREYIGTYEAWRLFVAFNSWKDQYLTANKSAFSVFAAAANLPTPEMLAVVSRQPNNCGVPSLGTEEALGAWMRENAISDVVLKPIDGTHGWGVISLGKQVGEGQWQKLPQKDTIDLATIWTHCARYLYRGGAIIQRRLVPHPVLAKLMPNVLHTARIITYLKPQPVLIDAVLRVGNGQSGADNLGQGGIAVPINLEAGRCEQGTILLKGLPQRIDDHPVTGARMTGTVLPDWDNACELAKLAAQKFPMMKTIGWDVGLTTEGPILVEANSTYDLTLNQIARRKGILTTRWGEAYNRERAQRRSG